MHILVTGAAGMLGQKLIRKLAKDQIAGQLTLTDMMKAQVPDDFSGKVTQYQGDISHADFASVLVQERPDVIFHLAAIVSGEAEQDFAKGNAINLDGTRYLLEACRHHSARSDYCPRFVFSSSIAVFGGSLPPVVGDDQRLTPLSSYGTQKAIGELMVADYTRKGFVDGISLRLPTITVRPGKPNKAASGFYSGIIREPLNGKEAILPVPKTVRHWFQSPRLAIANLALAGHLDLTDCPPNRALSLPGVSATIAEMMAALGRASNAETVALIREEHDPFVLQLVETWPKAFDAKTAIKLGFCGDTCFDEIIQVYLEDDKVTQE